MQGGCNLAYDDLSWNNMVSQLTLRTAKKTMSKTHKNAVLTPTGRFAMVDENTLVEVAIWFNVIP